MAQDAGYKGTLEELIAAFQGDSAYEIAVAKGYTGSQEDWLNSLVGANGKDGITPRIGANGNWYIGNVNTGVKAQGENGLSAYEIFKKYNPDYLGTEQQWMEALTKGQLVRCTITFKAAGHPDIVKSVFYGFELTDIPKAPEQDGETVAWDKTDFSNITEDIIVNATYNGFVFELINEDAEYKLVSANADRNVSVLEIPSEYEGKPVTTIGQEAFVNNTYLTHVTIPNTIKKIETRAFYGCVNMQSMTIPFVGEHLNSMTNTHFGHIFGVKNSELPQSLTAVVMTGGNSIKQYAFAECANLTSITIPDSVTFISGAAFYNSPNVQYEVFGGHFRYLNNALISVDSTKITEAILKPTTTVIGSSAFDGCADLTAITIPNSVTSIGDRSFFGCASLTSIAIPNHVTSIGSNAFTNCTNLTSITIPNSVTSIGGFVFLDCSRLTSITIPDSITTIRSGSFKNCINLKSIVIPSSITVIGSSAFENCTSLTAIRIPNFVTDIYSDAFAGCKGLTSISLGGRVEAIHLRAFKGCTSLTTITIPEKVTIISESLFDGCTSLKSVIMSDGITSIENSAFSTCISMTPITIPKSVISIQYLAFASCNALTKVWYGGATLAAWNNIEIDDSYNFNLTNSARYYYSETAIYDGKHWRYVDTVPTVWLQL